MTDQYKNLRMIHCKEPHRLGGSYFWYEIRDDDDLICTCTDEDHAVTILAALSTYKRVELI